MEANVEKLHEFILVHLDNDRVLYDCQEVEQLIRQAWFASVKEAKDDRRPDS